MHRIWDIVKSQKREQVNSRVSTRVSEDWDARGQSLHNQLNYYALSSGLDFARFWVVLRLEPPYLLQKILAPSLPCLTLWLLILCVQHQRLSHSFKHNMSAHTHSSSFGYLPGLPTPSSRSPQLLNTGHCWLESSRLSPSTHLAATARHRTPAIVIEELTIDSTLLQTPVYSLARRRRSLPVCDQYEDSSALWLDDPTLKGTPPSREKTQLKKISPGVVSERLGTTGSLGRSVRFESSPGPRSITPTSSFHTSANSHQISVHDKGNLFEQSVSVVSKFKNKLS